jgi:8-oxo-dGTP diphosphatase
MAYHHCKLIASGVARLHGDLLLVQQSYPGDPLPSWGLPGGQVEPGEELLAGLQRESLEETGLTLVGTPTIAFVLQVLRETEEGIQEWLACHFACEVAGQISPHDPDGLLLSAHWVEEQAALEYLGTDPGYDCEPLRRWLCGEAASGTVYTVKVK